MHLGPTQEVVDHGLVHHHALDFLGRDLPGDLPRQPADFALQLTHARLAGVARDHFGQSVVGDLELLRRDTVLIELPRDQILPGNLLLLPLGVA